MGLQSRARWRALAGGVVDEARVLSARARLETACARLPGVCVQSGPRPFLCERPFRAGGFGSFHGGPAFALAGEMTLPASDFAAGTPCRGSRGVRARAGRPSAGANGWSRRAFAVFAIAGREWNAAPAGLVKIALPALASRPVDR